MCSLAFPDAQEHLNRSAVIFRREATQLRNVMWWRNAKTMMCIGAIVVLVILLIVVMACGWDFECGGGKNEAFRVFASRSIAPSQYELVRAYSIGFIGHCSKAVEPILERGGRNKTLALLLCTFSCQCHSLSCCIWPDAGTGVPR